MGILTLKPMGLSLLCLIIFLGTTQANYETISIAQPPCSTLPPASAPVSIEQPPDDIVLPPASAPTSIAEPPSSTVLPPASAPTSITEPPISTVLPPASAPTSITEPPISTVLPPASAPTSITEPPISTVLPPASAPTSIAEPPISTVLPPASAPTSITEPPISTVLPPASAPISITEPPSSTALPPASAPVQQPVEPPNQVPGRHLPPRKPVAVQGAVYCKPCQNRGLQTLSGAAPLQGAVVKLQCKNTKYPTVVQTKTDKNGQFFINGLKAVSTYGYHKCKVFLVSSPDNGCNIPTNLHDGVQGAMLMRSTKPPESAQTPVDFDLFKVGPFAFDHTMAHPCSSLAH